ncbi:MAG TPA: 50S ribosomal protein L5 [Bacilli bacterium]|nr:50S ribosomal protein L5 [Bacilli bacterium]HQA19305.1 50S ribosomal protein L5 [Bacilli bacterium]
MNRVQNHYLENVRPALMKKFGYTSIMQVPKIEKIVVNMGVGDAIHNPKLLDAAVEELTQIVGQKPVITRAKKSIAGFKLRAGAAIGCKATLRGERMYEFYDKLVTIAIPRLRDFRGLSKDAFDGRGNYTIGIKEQLIFPEVNYDKVLKIRGMDIVIVTTAKTDEEGLALLTELGMPFRK